MKEIKKERKADGRTKGQKNKKTTHVLMTFLFVIIATSLQLEYS